MRAKDLSVLGNSAISNHPVLGSIHVIAVKVNVTGTPIVSSRCVFTVYGPMRSACTSDHGVTSAVFTGNLPYLGLFVFLNFLRVAHLLTSLTQSTTKPSQSHDC